MKLAYKNTEYKLKINLTNNKIGLLNDDVWCNVILNITNKEFNYHINRQSLSKNELEKIFNYSEILMCRPFPFTWETMSSRTALLNLPQME